MRFSKAVVRGRVAILILTVILMIPAVFGMLGTRINYDMLNYLPDDMDTVIGQNALLEDFGKGAFSFIVVEDMPEKDVAALQEKLESGRACGDGPVVQLPDGHRPSRCSFCPTSSTTPSTPATRR